jgi:hypothetical protein
VQSGGAVGAGNGHHGRSQAFESRWKLMEEKRTIPIAGLSALLRPTMMGSQVVHLVGTQDSVHRALCGKKPRRATTHPKEGNVTCFDCVVRLERGEMTSV